MGFQVDPNQILQMIRQGNNPQQLMLNILEANMSNTPFGANLLQLAKNGKTSEIEQIARNLLSARGMDFDKEFMAFRQRLGL